MHVNGIHVNTVGSTWNRFCDVQQEYWMHVIELSNIQIGWVLPVLVKEIVMR